MTWSSWGHPAKLILALPILFSLCPAQAPPAKENPEQRELYETLSDANGSAVDLVRLIESYLKKHPQTSQRAELERILAKASIETKDDRRIVQYGEQVLAATPDDMLLLDRVARSLLTLGGRENAERALKYSAAFEAIVDKLPAAEGKEAARRQEDRDRALSRTLLYQAKANLTLGHKEDAERLAAKAFSVYPAEEAAREWADVLAGQGRKEEAVMRLADAFAIPDSRAMDTDRASDRRRLGELYRSLHGNEKGLGDVILAAYDRTEALLEERRGRLRALDPNSAATDPMQFTITGLDGKKLTLASLKGSVVVLDFWATWCQPCRTQHPMYEDLKKRFEGRSDVLFLSIDTDEDRSLVPAYLDKQKWSPKIYFEDGLMRFLQVTSIPTTMLFDKQGRIASRMTGFVPEHFVDQLTERIKSALDEAP